MTWNRARLEPEKVDKSMAVVGECNRCYQCCVCWIYDQPDQPADVPPKKDWCPELDMETSNCRIWDERPEGCRSFPTERAFELGAVPEGCGFRLVKGGNKNGQIR